MRKSNFWWSEEQTDFLIQNYKTLTYKEIGNILNKSKKTVNNKALKLNLIKEIQPRYNINGDFFENLDNEKCYILSLIITDGCISNNRLEIQLNRRDKYL